MIGNVKEINGTNWLCNASMPRGCTGHSVLEGEKGEEQVDVPIYLMRNLAQSMLAIAWLHGHYHSR